MRVLLFGPVRAQLGADQMQVDAGSCDELWSQLLARCPGLKVMRSSIRLARNGEFLAPDATLDPEDEIALIPPVSGG